MSLQSLRLYRILRVSVALLTLGALLFSPFSNTITLAEAGSISPGLRSASEETLGREAYAPDFESAKLTASDGAASDHFGEKVALSGDTALVGAFLDDDNGSASGSAYIFERDQGGVDKWGQVKKITASDGAAGNWFGSGVALSGDTAVVGAVYDDDNGTYSGSVYIFERDQGGVGNWGEVKKLTASDGAAYDQFGWSLTISGDTVLVGALGSIAGAYTGAVYLFERNHGGAGNWGEVKKITASDGATGDYFGSSVTLNGDTALVGAYGDDDKGSKSGSAYILGRDQGGTGNWGEVKKLTASDGAADDYFGFSVALNGDTALVGAYWDDDDGAGSGSAYLFERDLGGTDNWGQTTKLTAFDGAANDWFGFSVALSGDIALVGARNDDDAADNAGNTFLFDRDQGGADNWGLVDKLTASDGNSEDYFGGSVALSGETALIGAYGKEDNGYYAGAAYVFGPNLLANGSFEDPLGAEWTEVVSANGDGRVPLNQAYLGSYIYLFQADGGLEIIKQTVTQSGDTGDEYTLTLYFGGKNVDLSGKLGARLMFKNGGVKVDKKLCLFTPSGSSFSWSSFSCTLTATGAFDTIEVLIGIKDVPSGMVGVDAAVLTKTGEAP